MRSCLENVQRLDAAPDTTSRNMKMMELVNESQHFNSQWIELGNAGELWKNFANLKEDPGKYRSLCEDHFEEHWTGAKD